MTPRPAAPGLAREDEHLRKLAALRARLHEDALALRTPGEWAARLRLAALMPGEDFANILLISSQRPGATLVRDYRQWTATGRQVRRHESGIETFRIPPRPAPRRPQDRDKRDDDEPPPTWRDADRVAYVWDLSQTTGQPVAPPGLPAPGQAPAGLWDALCWLARREGFAVEREDGAPADGTTFWTARRIRLLPGLTGEQAVWALAHQLGHVMLHAAPGPHPPGTTTSGCMGLRKAEADSVAYITCARHGVTVSGELACPASWAGSDPRAQPAAAILTAGHRIATAATRVIRHTDRVLHGDDPPPVPAPRQRPVTPAAGRAPTRQDDASSRQAATSAERRAAPRPPGGPGPRTLAVLRDAEAYYTSQLAGSWAPGYLASRGVSDVTSRDWDIGYAPAGWSALTGHLRGLGHDDREIQAAGLAKPSSRGTLIDIFRDRIMLPVRDSGGTLAGFIGRAHPRAGPDVPKYINSPETAAYRKGNLLFGLHHARPALAQGATPVLVEGPFDAIAVTIADGSARRARPLRHCPDQPASRPDQPGRRSGPHRHPRRLRQRRRRAQSRPPRLRHPPAAHREPANSAARWQGPGRDPATPRPGRPAQHPPRPPPAPVRPAHRRQDRGMGATARRPQRPAPPVHSDAQRRRADRRPPAGRGRPADPPHHRRPGTADPR